MTCRSSMEEIEEKEEKNKRNGTHRHTRLFWRQKTIICTPHTSVRNPIMRMSSIHNFERACFESSSALASHTHLDDSNVCKVCVN